MGSAILPADGAAYLKAENCSARPDQYSSLDERRRFWQCELRETEEVSNLQHSPNPAVRIEAMEFPARTKNYRSTTPKWLWGPYQYERELYAIFNHRLCELCRHQLRKRFIGRTFCDIE